MYKILRRRKWSQDRMIDEDEQCRFHTAFRFRVEIMEIQNRGLRNPQEWSRTCIKVNSGIGATMKRSKTDPFFKCEIAAQIVMCSESNQPNIMISKNKSAKIHIRYLEYTKQAEEVQGAYRSDYISIGRQVCADRRRNPKQYSFGCDVTICF